MFLTCTKLCSSIVQHLLGTLPNTAQSAKTCSLCKQHKKAFRDQVKVVHMCCPHQNRQSKLLLHCKKVPQQHASAVGMHVLKHSKVAKLHSSQLMTIKCNTALLIWMIKAVGIATTHQQAVICSSIAKLSALTWHKSTADVKGQTCRHVAREPVF